MSRLDLEYDIKREIPNSPIVREIDRTRQRELWRSAAIGVCLVAVLLFSAWQHFELLRHGYEIEQMEQERAGVDAGAVLALYRRFDELNGIFKDGISGWQTSPDPEAARPTLVNTITAIHANLIPLIGEVADQLPRLRSFADHFENALGAIRNGDDSMIASPLKDSYHTSWFELHEELIALANLDRATEEMNRPST